MGEPAAQIVAVSGEVLLDGKPVRGASVVFVPQDKSLGVRFEMSYAETDEDGKFQLRISEQKEGAYEGLNYVLISKADHRFKRTETGPFPFPSDGIRGGEQDLMRLHREYLGTEMDLIPSFYNSESELVFEVKRSESNYAKFELSSVDPLLETNSRE